MKVYTQIPISLLPFFNAELKKYEKALAKNDLQKAWEYLERAHILGQRYPYHHSLVHWKMLKFGIRIKSLGEILGQIPRLLVGGVKSFVGTVPVGNPGGANVTAMKPFPIDEEIQSIFRKAGVPV